VDMAATTRERIVCREDTSCALSSQRWSIGQDERSRYNLNGANRSRNARGCALVRLLLS